MSTDSSDSSDSSDSCSSWITHERLEGLAESEDGGALTETERNKLVSLVSTLEEYVKYDHELKWLLNKKNEIEESLERDKMRLEELKAGAEALEIELIQLRAEAAEHEAILKEDKNDLSKLKEELKGLKAKRDEISRLLRAARGY